MAKVKFFAVDLKSTFESLAVKDEFALYWIMETQQLYKGNILFGTGVEATANMAGLMSAEDKKKLDTITGINGGIRFLGVSSTDPNDGIITIDKEIISPIAGDIVIFGTKEYIYDKNNNFVELGDEGAYLTKAQAETDYLKKVDAKNIYETKENAYAEYKRIQEELETKLEQTTAQLEEVSTQLEEASIQLEESTATLNEAKTSMVWGTIG